MIRRCSRARRVVACASLVVLSACETTPPLPAPESSPEQAWQQRLQSLENFDTWFCAGRVGVDDGKEAFSASLRWQQRRDNYDIRLFGPLGQGVAHVVGTPDGVALRTSDRDATLVAPTAELLLEQSLGWPLPISGLRFWILGITMPDMPVESRELDRWGRLVSLEQSGWRIRYTKYAQVNGIDLPVRMELDHVPFSARIAVNRWEPGT